VKDHSRYLQETESEANIGLGRALKLSKGSIFNISGRSHGVMINVNKSMYFRTKTPIIIQIMHTIGYK